MFPVSVADLRIGLVFVERIVRTAVLGRIFNLCREYYGSGHSGARFDTSIHTEGSIQAGPEFGFGAM